MFAIAAFIATICLSNLIIHFLPLEDRRKKKLMKISGCLATVSSLGFFYWKLQKNKEIAPPMSPKLSQVSADSFSQASRFSGGSLLSDF